MGFGKLPAMLPLCIAVFMARDAMALGVGEAYLDSNLGQPLFARIPIFGAEGIGSEQVRVTLTPATDPGSGIEVASVDARNISAVGEMGADGTGTIYLRSSKHIDEPFLHFLVNVRWPGGQLTRAYTFLMDLPEDQAAGSVNTSSLNTSSLTPALLNNGSENSTRPINLSAQTGAVLSAGLSPRSLNGVEVKRQIISADTLFYTSERGDSLWSIALRVARQKNGSINEWMTRLYRNNPAAFIRNNRNLLKERFTLDLFESVVEPSVADESRFLDETPASAVSQQVTKPELRGAGVDIPRPSGSDMQNTAFRREAELDGDSDDMMLTEKQFLQQNLSDVRNQVSGVSANIALMTAQLVALQAQLENLQSQAAILNATGVAETEIGSFETQTTVLNNMGVAETEATFFTGPGAEPLVNSAITGSLDDIVVVGVGQDDGVMVGDSAFVNELRNNGFSEESTGVSVSGAALNNIVDVAAAPAVERTTAAVTDNTESSFWSWLWLLVPLIGGLLLLIRYRKGDEFRTLSELADANAALAAKINMERADANAALAVKTHIERAIADDHFDDVFSALDAKSAGAQNIPLTSANMLSEQDNLGAGSQSHEQISKTQVEMDDRATPSDGQVGNASFAEIDDDFFTDIDEDDLTLDVPDLDESWLALDAVQGDAIERASACMALGDYLGARQVLEQDIAVNDDISLKMQLLDVHAHCGDQDDFENLVLQMESAASDEQLHTEIDVLRELLLKNVDSISKNRAD